MASNSTPENQNTSTTTATTETTSPNNTSIVGDMKEQLNSFSYGNAILELGNNVSTLAGESVNEIRNRVSGVSAGDVVQNIKGSVQSYTSGQGQETTNGSNQDAPPDAEENERIDNIEKEKIVEFMQERHKSTANKPSTN